MRMLSKVCFIASLSCVSVPALCHATPAAQSTCVSSNKTGDYGQGGKAGCMWARLGKMVNITFAALGDLARNVSASAEEIKAKAFDAKKKAVELLDKNLQAEAEKALGVAEVAALKANDTLQEVEEAKNVVKDKLFRAQSCFKDSTRYKEDIVREFFDNFTLCETNHSLNLTFLDNIKVEIAGNLPNLTDWKNNTKKVWDKEASEAWEEIVVVGNGGTKNDWNNAWSKLKEQLEKVMIPLMNATFNLTAAKKQVNETVVRTTSKAGNVTRDLIAEHDVLCNVSRQVSSMVSVLGGLQEQTRHNASEAEKYSKIAANDKQKMQSDTAVLYKLVPVSKINSTLNGTLHEQMGAATLWADNASKLAEEAHSAAEKVKEGVQRLNESANGALVALHKRMTEIKAKVKNISSDGNTEIAEACSENSELLVPKLPDLLSHNVFENTESWKDRETVRSDLTRLSSNFTLLQKTSSEMSKRAKLARAAVEASTSAKNKTEAAIVSELRAKRAELCAVKCLLASAKAHNRTLDAHVLDVQALVGKARARDEATKREVAKTRSDAARLQVAREKVGASLAVARDAHKAVQDAVSGNVEGSETVAAETREALNRVEHEQRRVADETLKQDKLRNNVVVAMTAVGAAEARLDASQKNVADARRNITSALGRIEETVNRIDAEFSVAAKGFSDLRPDECSNDCQTVVCEPTGAHVKNVAATMTKLFQFINETEEKELNDVNMMFNKSSEEMLLALEVARSSDKEAEAQMELAMQARRSSRRSTDEAFEAARRAATAAREAQDAAKLAATGCRPLYRQFLSALVKLD
ncbi:hypothetical protein TRVL_07125 [Trypanosoma vivax]|nr:hypothetical protein TRVL_07125 [Trypanosoma vivax]